MKLKTYVMTYVANHLITVLIGHLLPTRSVEEMYKYSVPERLVCYNKPWDTELDRLLPQEQLAVANCRSKNKTIA